MTELKKGTRIMWDNERLTRTGKIVRFLGAGKYMVLPDVRLNGEPEIIVVSEIDWLEEEKPNA